MSSSMRSGVTNSNNNNKFGKECMCGRGEECKGISAAFALLNDPRRGYVMVPNMIQNPTTQYMREMNGLREAYLRHLATDNAILDLCKDINVGEEDDSGSPKFIALHHFHPTVVETHAEKAEIEAARRNKKSKGPKIPRTLKPVDVKFLQIEGLTDQDRVRDEYNQLTDLFYFVPNYPMRFVKEDLKKAIRVSRLMSADVGSIRSARSRSSSRRAASRHRHSAAAATLSARDPPLSRAMATSQERSYSLRESARVTHQRADVAAAVTAPAVAASVATSIKSGRESKKKKKKRGRSKSTKNRRKSSKHHASDGVDAGDDLWGKGGGAASIAAASGAVKQKTRTKSKSRRSLSRRHKPWQEKEHAEGGPTHDDLEDLEPTRTASQDDIIDRRVAASKSTPPQLSPRPVERTVQPPPSPPVVKSPVPPPPPVERTSSTTQPPTPVQRAPSPPPPVERTPSTTQPPTPVQRARSPSPPPVEKARPPTPPTPVERAPSPSPSPPPVERVQPLPVPPVRIAQPPPPPPPPPTPVAPQPPPVERDQPPPPPPPVERAIPPPTAGPSISPAAAVGVAAAGVAAGAVATTRLFTRSHSSDDDISPPPPTTRTRPMVDEDEDRMQPKPAPRTLSPVPPPPPDDTTPPLKDEEESAEGPAHSMDKFLGEDTVVPPPPPESALNGLDLPTLGTTTAAVAAVVESPKQAKEAAPEEDDDFDDDATPIVDMTDEMRSEMYHDMLRFESRRRAQYADSMDRCESDWRACLEAMQAGIFETARAERSILGAALASQAYSDAMQAICEDTYIDDEGDIVLNQMVRNRLARSRQKEEEQNVETVLTSPSKDQRYMWSEAARVNLLDDLVDVSADLAAKFDENATNVSDQVVAEMTDLRKQLKVQMLSVKKRGDTLVREMKRAEREVLIAWSAFDAIGGSQMEKQMADEILPEAMELDDSPLLDPLSPQRPATTEDLAGSTHGRSSSRRGTPLPIRPNSLHGAPSSRHSTPRRDGSTPRSGGWTRKQSSFQIHQQQQETEATAAAETQGRLGASPVTSSFRSLVSIRDVWIAEMFYKAAVNYESHVWERCMGEMARLYGTLQDIELERQFKLHQVLSSFMPRQRRLSLSLTPVMEPIFLSLVNTREYTESMEDIVEEAIRRLSEDKLKKDQGVRSKYMNRSRANVRFHQQDVDLEPPEGEIFDNGLLRGTKILERKLNVRQWRTSLCVVTADGTLHLMDLHLFPKFAAGHSADQAFGELLPKYTMPNDSTIEPEARVGTITKNLSPSVSVNLSKSTCRTDPFDPTVLELTETFKGYFRDDATRKIHLRMTIREEAEQWKGLLLEFLSETALGESNHNNNRGTTPQLSTLKQVPSYDLSHGISYGEG